MTITARPTYVIESLLRSLSRTQGLAGWLIMERHCLGHILLMTPYHMHRAKELTVSYVATAIVLAKLCCKIKDTSCVCQLCSYILRRARFQLLLNYYAKSATRWGKQGIIMHHPLTFHNSMYRITWRLSFRIKHLHMMCCSSQSRASIPGKKFTAVHANRTYTW